MMDLTLKNRNAIVGGSSKGIGKATAIQLAKQGANIILFARNEDALKEVQESLDTSSGQQHEFQVVDYSNPEELKKTGEKIITKKPVHILVNNTGGPAPGPAHKADTDAFLAAFRQHLICNQILTQLVIPGMQEASYGRIINVISTSVKQPIPNLGVSNTIRGAVANWSKTLSNELAQYGITVNNVLPGATYTERLVGIIENRVKKLNKPYEEVEKMMQDEIPAKRFAKPEELANAIGFLASPSAAYINGINLPVDGGRTGCL